MSENNCGSYRFLVFGGAGYLGHHLVSALLHDYPHCAIAVMDRSPREHPPCCFEGDSRVGFHFGVDILQPETYASILGAGADCLFNLAGCISYWIKDQDLLFRVNVEGVQRLFAAVRRVSIPKAVHVSSVAAIGYSGQDRLPADETLPMRWSRFRRKHYMFSKHLGEVAALRHSGDSLQVVVVNPGVMYGPGEIQDVLRLFRNLAAGKIPAYPPGGTGVVDVRDAACGLLAAYRRGRPGHRYILASENYPFADILRLASQALGVTGPASRLPTFLAAARPIVRGLELMSRTRPKLTADEFSFGFLRRYYSGEKARRELGWDPRFSLSQSLQDTAEWYRCQGLLPDRTAEGTDRV